jgi:hypothetical protein
VFGVGIDELELRLEGKANGTIVTCSGTVDGVPGMVLEATLIPNQKQPSVLSVGRSPLDLKKLPNAHALRQNASGKTLAWVAFGQSAVGLTVTSGLD